MRTIPPVPVLLVPLRWLRQSRRFWRLPLLLTSALVLGTGGLLLSREVVLWQIPDVPEPVDLARSGHVDLPDADNAMVFYKRAAGLLVKHPPNMPRRSLMSRTGRCWDWTQSSPEVRDLLAANRTALDVWRFGTTRSDSLLIQPEQARITPPELEMELNDVLILAYLGTLEATRLQAEDDLAGAWTNYLAVLRSGIHASRHHGISFSRLEARILEAVIPRIRAWANDPALSPDLLAQANADLADCQRLMPSFSDMIRAGYFRMRDNLGNPEDWRSATHHSAPVNEWTRELTVAQRWLMNEPKRSQRIFRLLTAGQLAQLDRPSEDRARLVAPRYLIFDRDPRKSSPLARVKPSALNAWANGSGCRTEVPDLGSFLTSIQAARASFESLRSTLAERSRSLGEAEITARDDDGASAPQGAVTDASTGC